MRGRSRALGAAALLALGMACSESASIGNLGGSTAGAGGGAGAAGDRSAGAGAGAAASAGASETSGAGAGQNGGGTAGAGAVSGGAVSGGADSGGDAGAGGGEGCEPLGKPRACGDALESKAGVSAMALDGATTTVSEVDGLVGAKAVRVVTESGLLVTVRVLLTQQWNAQATDELRLLVRGKNTNTGWQGNVPRFTLEDASGKRRSYEPAGALFPVDGITWYELRAPLAGGAGFTTFGDDLDFGHIMAVELTADTWEAGFTLDLDGLSVVPAGAQCALTCEHGCSGRGECSSTGLSCVCEPGAEGNDCSSCRAGFTLKDGHCQLNQDGDYDTWPNAVSKTNGDAWLQVHHQAIKTLEPTLLALNFVNPSIPANVETLLGDVIAGFREGSRPLGAQNPAAAPGLDYQLLDVVDLRDGVDGRPAPPQGYAYDNSTLFPRRAVDAPGAWRFDYAALFSDAFAPYYGFADPDAPGKYLNLCQLIDSGRVNELWIVGSGDVMTDVNAAEVLESKQRYDGGRNPIPGVMDKCAGNGCFDDDVPHCARSVRIGFVNYNRGPGCYLHSQGHGLESTARRHIVQPLSEWFLPLAGFDLSQRYNLPGESFYELLGGLNHAEYPAPNALDVVQNDTTTHVQNYVAGCGNVHFPPNANNHYDYTSTVPVTSDCSDYGRNVAGCRPRQTENVTAQMWANYEPLAPDCGGAFLVWWYQHLPGYRSEQLFDDGREMLSVWPFLFY